MRMTVVAIHIGEQEADALRAVEAVQARAGKGLEGDRHFHPAGAPAGNARPGIMRELAHRAGIYADVHADVLADGTIAVGDRVVFSE
jgi:hypothetical protein